MKYNTVEIKFKGKSGFNYKSSLEKYEYMHGMTELKTHADNNHRPLSR